MRHKVSASSATNLCRPLPSSDGPALEISAPPLQCSRAQRLARVGILLALALFFAAAALAQSGASPLSARGTHTAAGSKHHQHPLSMTSRAALRF